MTLNLEPIKARLEACTAAAVDCKWSYNKDDSTLYNIDSFYLETNKVVHGPVIMHEDGKFIANAPTDIAMLVNEVERLQELQNTIKNDILSIGDVLSAAVSHGGDIDYHALNDKLHEMYLLLEE